LPRRSRPRVGARAAHPAGVAAQAACDQRARARAQPGVRAHLPARRGRRCYVCATGRRGGHVDHGARALAGVGRAHGVRRRPRGQLHRDARPPGPARHSRGGVVTVALPGIAGSLFVITGAAGGQGAEEALLLAAQGAEVVAADIRDDAPALLEAAASLSPADGTRPGSVSYRRLDVTDEAEWAALAGSLGGRAVK